DAAVDDAAGNPDGADGGPPPVDMAPCGGDILANLRTVPGLVISEQTSMVAGYRFFTMTLEQPEDHMQPMGAKFLQRLTLLHHDCAAPTIVYNSGYNVSTQAARTELTRLVNGNQISMEHRFFGSSLAPSPDWTKLNIAQAAADQHRVIATFRPFYGGH